MLSTLLCVSAVLCYNRYNVTDNFTCPNGSVAPTLLEALKIADKLNETSFSFVLREMYLNKSLRFMVDNSKKKYQMYVLEHVKPKYLYCAMPQSSSSLSYWYLIGLIIAISCWMALGIALWRLAINYGVIIYSSNNDNNNA